MSGRKVCLCLPVSVSTPNGRLTRCFAKDFVIKYMWSAAGYMLISIPVMLNRRHSVGVQTRSDDDAEVPDGVTVVNDAVAKRTESTSFPLSSSILASSRFCYSPRLTSTPQ